MPFYDISRSETTNGSGGSSSYHFAAATLLSSQSQEIVSIMGVFAASRFGTAGGAQFRVAHNTGTKYTGGAAFTPSGKNLRISTLVTCVSSWVSDGSAITPGSALVQRLSVGFAQTGGMGGWVPLVPSDALQMMTGSTQPIDMEFSSLATSASVTFDATIEITEGQS